MSLEGYNTLKKSRSALTGVVTRMKKRYLKLSDGDPSTYDVSNMTSSLTSLDTTAQHFYTSQEEIMEYVDVRGDIPFNEEDELNAIEIFEDSVSATKSLINRLMATKRALNLHSELLLMIWQNSLLPIQMRTT